MFRYVVIPLLLSHTAAAAPITLDTSGRLLDADGEPIQGEQAIRFDLWSDAGGTQNVHSETLTLAFDDGYYSAKLGEDGDLDSSEVAVGALWLEVRVGSTSLGITPISHVPMAAVAESLVGGVADVTSVQVNGVTVIDDNGVVTGACPAGWVDIGPKCAKAAPEVAQNYGNAVVSCYDQGARLCDEQDHVYMCLRRSELNLPYADQQWYWTGTRSWEQYNGGATYETHHLARRVGSVCWHNGSSTLPSNHTTSWGSGSSSFPGWCCRDR